MLDQRWLAPALRGWFGPSTIVAELIDTRILTFNEVKKLCMDCKNIILESVLFPVSWANSMGFSWSSDVAEQRLSHVLAHAGLIGKRIFADDCLSPIRTDSFSQGVAKPKPSRRLTNSADLSADLAFRGMPARMLHARHLRLASALM